MTAGCQPDRLVSDRVWAALGGRRAMVILFWVVAVVVGAQHLWHAVIWFDDPPGIPDHERRADGNRGATQIDFGGQWVMGRMVVCGHAGELYHRQKQWEVVRAAYPVANEPWVVREEAILPKYERVLARPGDEVGHDADHLLFWFMGTDPKAWKTVGGAVAAPLVTDPFAALALERAAAELVTDAVVAEVSKPAIGGPLYPPIQAFLYAPLGLFDRPRVAYHVLQVILTGVTFLAALGISVLSRGRIWWSLATIGLFLFPGSRAGLDLGQNPVLTLAILVWGWVLVSRNREWAGGAVWGLLAFKPVWGLAFALVPLLTGRWRMGLAMLGTGCALAAATLPFVGWQTWFDWLAVGREAAALYNVNKNWVNLSRDLQGLFRRVLLDFDAPEAGRDTPLAKAVGWGLWGVIVVTTALVYRLKADRRRVLGVGAAFLLFGAFLSCYRFMYYDVLLAALPVAVLLAEPGRFFRTRVFGLAFAEDAPDPADDRLAAPAVRPDPFGPRLVGYVNSLPLTLIAGLFIADNVLLGLEAQGTFGLGYWATPTTAADGATGLATPRVSAATGIGSPVDTLLVIALWAWCGWRLLRGEEQR